MHVLIFPKGNPSAQRKVAETTSITLTQDQLVLSTTTTTASTASSTETTFLAASDGTAGVTTQSRPKQRCSDTAGFTDSRGHACEAWRGFDCQRAISLGYSLHEAWEVLENCAGSCNYCPQRATTTLLTTKVRGGAVDSEVDRADIDQAQSNDGSASAHPLLVACVVGLSIIGTCGLMAWVGACKRAPGEGYHHKHRQNLAHLLEMDRGALLINRASTGIKEGMFEPNPHGHWPDGSQYPSNSKQEVGSHSAGQHHADPQQYMWDVSAEHNPTITKKPKDSASHPGSADHQMAALRDAMFLTRPDTSGHEPQQREDNHHPAMRAKRSEDLIYDFAAPIAVLPNLRSAPPASARSSASRPVQQHVHFESSTPPPFEPIYDRSLAARGNSDPADEPFYDRGRMNLATVGPGKPALSTSDQIDRVLQSTINGSSDRLDERAFTGTSERTDDIYDNRTVSISWNTDAGGAASSNDADDSCSWNSKESNPSAPDDDLLMAQMDMFDRKSWPRLGNVIVEHIPLFDTPRTWNTCDPICLLPHTSPARF